MATSPVVLPSGRPSGARLPTTTSAPATTKVTGQWGGGRREGSSWVQVFQAFAVKEAQGFQQLAGHVGDREVEVLQELRFRSMGMVEEVGDRLQSEEWHTVETGHPGDGCGFHFLRDRAVAFQHLVVALDQLE